MRIGIVSDTHMFSRAKALPQKLIEGLQGVDLILHAGDWTDPAVVSLFENLASVEGVAGNNDGADLIMRFGRKKLLTLGKYRIGIIHGDGYRRTTEQRAWEAFSPGEADMIIFGHSHIPFMKNRQGVLMFNPGSPTDKRMQPLYSYGIAELGDQLNVEHHFYEQKV